MGTIFVGGGICMVGLLGKKRKEYQVLNLTRISYSLDDVLFEDFIDQKVHPYAIYDLKGNLLETNVEVGTFQKEYDDNIKFLLYIIGKYGMR